MRFIFTGRDHGLIMLSAKEQKLIADYETQLRKPKWKFVRRNALYWACLVFVSSLVSDYFFESQPFTIRRFFIRIIILVIAGVAFGFLFRWDIQRRYNKLLQKQSAGLRSEP